MIDLLIKCTPNGGELVQKGNDLATVSGIENTMYLAMFGGQRWWGNFMVAEHQRFTSQTLKALREQPLNSAGRLVIQRAAEADLAYLSEVPGTRWRVNVALTTPPSAPLLKTGGEFASATANPNRVIITVDVNGTEFEYLYNPLEDLESVVPDVPVCALLTGLTLVGVTCGLVAYSWTEADGAVGYEYAVTTGALPDSWTLTTDASAVVSGLAPGTAYRFWVRTKCGDGWYSEPVTDDQTTLPVPTVSITGGLVAKIFSEQGVTVSGSVGGLMASKVDDGTANHNNFSAGGADASYLLNELNGYPVLKFATGESFATTGNFSGLTGQAAATVFVVYRTPAQTGSRHIVGYPDAGVVSNGQWAMLDSPAGGGIPGDNVSGIVRGNVGFDSGYLLNTPDTWAVVAERINFAAGAGNELHGFKNGDPLVWQNLTTNNNTGTFTAQVMSLAWGGQMVACLLVYAAALSDADVLTVSEELRAKYGI